MKVGSIYSKSRRAYPDTLLPSQFRTLFNVWRIGQGRWKSNFFEIIADVVIEFPTYNPHFKFASHCPKLATSRITAVRWLEGEMGLWLN